MSFSLQSSYFWQCIRSMFFLVFPVSVLHLFFPVSKARKFSRQGHLRYLFLSLDLFMITLPNSLLMKGAWLPLTCFDFKWVCLCGIS